MQYIFFRMIVFINFEKDTIAIWSEVKIWHKKGVLIFTLLFANTIDSMKNAILYP